MALELIAAIITALGFAGIAILCCASARQGPPRGSCPQRRGPGMMALLLERIQLVLRVSAHLPEGSRRPAQSGHRRSAPGPFCPR